MKGSYVLLVELADNKNVTVGKLGSFPFAKGFYAYVGSAMNGLRGRLARHLSKDKKLHWHIDYLLQEGRVIEIIACPSGEKVECSLAQALASKLDPVGGFGASDCHCRSHLYFAADKDFLKAHVVRAIEKLGFAYGVLSWDGERWRCN
jgi:Uri superfamily endonuclease